MQIGGFQSKPYLFEKIHNRDQLSKYHNVFITSEKYITSLNTMLYNDDSKLVSKANYQKHRLLSVFDKKCLLMPLEFFFTFTLRIH